jgi:KH domain-containing RNA-binding signal transduction-associated protein 3
LYLFIFFFFTLVATLAQFNFVGKLLGPKGNSLKRLQEETLTKMASLGRGSMRDKHKVFPYFLYCHPQNGRLTDDKFKNIKNLKEEEYRHSHEPRYRHLNDDLHVEITAYAAPAEAHARIALALTEIRRFLVPVTTTINLFVISFFCVCYLPTTKCDYL